MVKRLVNPLLLRVLQQVFFGQVLDYLEAYTSKAVEEGHVVAEVSYNEELYNSS